MITEIGATFPTCGEDEGQECEYARKQTAGPVSHNANDHKHELYDLQEIRCMFCVAMLCIRVGPPTRLLTPH